MAERQGLSYIIAKSRLTRLPFSHEANSPMMHLLSKFPKMGVLLIFLPVTVVLQLLGVEGLWIFVISGLGILGTVTLIGKATEEIAIYTGPLWGGLLNATFGNVTELIIAMLALSKGSEEMYEVVRGSIVGSILGNLLLILGLAMIYGGMKYQTQKFSRTGAQVNVGMLWVVLITLAVPSLLDLTIKSGAFHKEQTVAAASEGEDEVPAGGESGDAGQAASSEEPTHATGHLDEAAANRLVRQVSLTAAIILLVLYGLMLVFSLRTHRFLIMPGNGHHEQAEWSKQLAIGTLLGATLAVAYLSEAFVGSIEAMNADGGLGISHLFIGVIVVAVVGNAAEGLVAVWVARDDKMELSFQIAMGSCLQVALMVAPVLVVASYFMGELLTLAFNPFELMSLGAAVLISSAALNDGESNWLEGSMFLAVYLFFALVFWFHP